MLRENRAARPPSRLAFEALAPSHSEKDECPSLTDNDRELCPSAVAIDPHSTSSGPGVPLARGSTSLSHVHNKSRALKKKVSLDSVGSAAMAALPNICKMHAEHAGRQVEQLLRILAAATGSREGVRFGGSLKQGW